MAAILDSVSLTPYLTLSTSKHLLLPELILLIHWLLFMVCLPSQSVNLMERGGSYLPYSPLSPRA